MNTLHRGIARLATTTLVTVCLCSAPPTTSAGENGEQLADVGRPAFELLVLLKPRLDAESLRHGEDLAIVSVPAWADVFSLRLYARPDGYMTTLVNRNGVEAAFESDVVIAEGGDDQGDWGGVVCSPTGSHCCLIVGNDSGGVGICVARSFTSDVDADAIVLGNGRLRLEVQPSVGRANDEDPEPTGQTLPGPHYIADDVQ